MTRRNTKSAFLTRKTTLVNKLKELTILCDIEAGMIFLDPYKTEPEIFARNPGEFIKECRKLNEREKLSETETMFDLLNARKKKIELEIKDLERKICYEEIYPSWDLKLESFTEEQLREVLGSLDVAMEVVNEKLESVSKGEEMVVDCEPLDECLCLPPPEDFRVSVDEPDMIDSAVQADDFWEIDQYINQSIPNGSDYVPCEAFDQDSFWDIVEGKQQNPSPFAQSGITNERTS